MHVYWARRHFREAGDKDQWITDLPKKELEELLPRMVYCDPGRRNEFYAMAAWSTADRPVTFRATGCQRRKSQRVRRFADIRRKAKASVDNNAVAEAEKRLSKNAWLGRDDTDHTTYQSARATTREAYERHVGQRAKEWDTLRNHYYECPTRGQDSPTQPLHRRLQLSAYLNRVKAERHLADKFRTVFGPDCVVVLGEWSAPMSKFHEPIKGVGLRRFFKKHGFCLVIIKEAFTSTWCPRCEDGRLEKWKWVPNPRPWMREKYPMVLCHGLLRCPNPTCLDEDDEKTGRRRLFDRDLAAVLNYRLIAESLAGGKGIPERFCHRSPTGDNNNADGSAPDPTAPQSADDSSAIQPAADESSVPQPDNGSSAPQPDDDDNNGSSGSVPVPRKRQLASEPAARASKRPCADNNSSSAPAPPRPSAPAAMATAAAPTSTPNNVFLRDGS
ncbi:hypothetical protein H4R19_001903 [Coemansia spiralis]|nr:hypothetical protein H4R19_001903 [Coemansia spiralis]